LESTSQISTTIVSQKLSSRFISRCLLVQCDYQNPYPFVDSTNPAFLLNNEKISKRQKARYILSQKWCWGLIFLVLMLCTFANTLFIVVWPQRELVYVTRYGWSAEPPTGAIMSTKLPVTRIITSQTGGDTCTSRVNDSVAFLLENI
jgi:hypothetical protein